MLDFLLLGASPPLRTLTCLLLCEHLGELLTHSIGREAGKTHRSQEGFVPRGEVGKVSFERTRPCLKDITSASSRHALMSDEDGRVVQPIVHRFQLRWCSKA